METCGEFSLQYYYTLVFYLKRDERNLGVTDFGSNHLFMLDVNLYLHSNLLPIYRLAVLSH
jgi:hypothetical protein